jgi:hypothetical protein
MTMLSVGYISFPHLTFEWLNQSLRNLVYTHMTATEPISTSYFLNPFHQSVCLCVYPISFGKIVTATTNTQATIEDLLDLSFSMRCVPYERKVIDKFFPELLVLTFQFDSHN